LATRRSGGGGEEGRWRERNRAPGGILMNITKVAGEKCCREPIGFVIRFTAGGSRKPQNPHR